MNYDETFSYIFISFFIAALVCLIIRGIEMLLKPFKK